MYMEKDGIQKLAVVGTILEIILEHLVRSAHVVPSLLGIHSFLKEITVFLVGYLLYFPHSAGCPLLPLT